MSSGSASRPEASVVSVVVPTYNEGERLRSTVLGILDSLPPGGEVIVVDDGSTDESAAFLATLDGRVHAVRTERQGAIAARNTGAARARGEVLVFADAHVDVPHDWWPPMAAELAHPQVGAVAPAISVMGAPEHKGFGQSWTSPALEIRWLDRRGSGPYAVPLLPGAFFAIRRETFASVGGFDPGLRVWGCEDVELSLRLWLFGYELRVVPQIDVAHFFRTRVPHPVSWTDVLHNLLRVALVHFSASRTARVLESFKGHAAFAATIAGMVVDDLALAARRAELRARRLRDDDWFFDTFEMNL